MPGKGIVTKHTAKDIKKRIAESSTNKGGGAAGAKDRSGGAAGHAKFKCPICAQQAPSLKSMQDHWDSKHSKLPWDPNAFQDMQAANGGVTTAGVAVRGSLKKKEGEK